MNRIERARQEGSRPESQRWSKRSMFPQELREPTRALVALGTPLAVLKPVERRHACEKCIDFGFDLNALDTARASLRSLDEWTPDDLVVAVTNYSFDAVQVIPQQWGLQTYAQIEHLVRSAPLLALVDYPDGGFEAFIPASGRNASSGGVSVLSQNSFTLLPGCPLAEEGASLSWRIPTVAASPARGDGAVASVLAGMAEADSLIGHGSGASHDSVTHHLEGGHGPAHTEISDLVWSASLDTPEGRACNLQDVASAIARKHGNDPELLLFAETQLLLHSLLADDAHDHGVARLLSTIRNGFRDGSPDGLTHPGL